MAAQIQITADKATQALRLARKYVGSNPASGYQESARICLADANELFDAYDYTYAYKAAVKSLAYSVGVFHPEYVKLTKHD
jgi:hypothetical protein